MKKFMYILILIYLFACNTVFIQSSPDIEEEPNPYPEKPIVLI